MAPYHYAESIPPDVAKILQPANPLAMTPEQGQAYNAVTQQYQRARAARLRGEVDVDAVRALSPRSFENLPPEQHEEVAHRLNDSLGMLRDAAHDRVVNLHPDGAKFRELTRTIESEPPTEHPRIIFARSLEAVDAIHQHLQNMGVKVGKIKGDMNGAKKQDVLSKFSPPKGADGQYIKEPEHDVIVCSDCAAAGINAQRASRVDHWDTPHTAMTFEQRIGRAHRTGQDRDVQVKSYVTESAYERRRRERLARKGALREALTTPAELIDESGLASRIHAAMQRDLRQTVQQDVDMRRAA
jgi:superfamily II DNA/RNA helicase